MNYIAFKIYLSCTIVEVDKWAAYMHSHEEEARASLRKENVVHEICYCGEDEEGLYLIGVMDCKEPETASQVAKQSELSVDLVHREFKKFWQNKEIIAIDPSRPPEFPEARRILDIRL